jgi:hypothetical protein
LITSWRTRFLLHKPPRSRCALLRTSCELGPFGVIISPSRDSYPGIVNYCNVWNITVNWLYKFIRFTLDSCTNSYQFHGSDSRALYKHRIANKRVFSNITNRCKHIVQDTPWVLPLKNKKWSSKLWNQFSTKTMVRSWFSEIFGMQLYLMWSLCCFAWVLIWNPLYWVRDSALCSLISHSSVLYYRPRWGWRDCALTPLHHWEWWRMPCHVLSHCYLWRHIPQHSPTGRFRFTRHILRNIQFLPHHPVFLPL